MWVCDLHTKENKSRNFFWQSWTRMLPGIIKHNQTLFGIKETILFFKKRLDTVYGLLGYWKNFELQLLYSWGQTLWKQYNNFITWYRKANSIYKLCVRGWVQMPTLAALDDQPNRTPVWYCVKRKRPTLGGLTILMSNHRNLQKILCFYTWRQCFENRTTISLTWY